MKRCIIIANGKPPAKKVIEFLLQKDHPTVICADGGTNYAKRLGVIPNYIIGDMDSISTETIKYFQNKSRFIRIKRQNDTDVEKCLKFAIRKKFTEAVLAGAAGDRLDHTFCNLGIVLKFFGRINIKIIAEKSLLSAYTGKVEIKTSPGEIFSVYGFDQKTKITSAGLKYPLQNTPLPFGKKESTSNAAVSDLVKLQIKGGLIFVIRDFDTVRRNGLF